MGYMKINSETGMEYEPGETIRGRAEWSFEQVQKSLEIHLVWYTSGKGTDDIEIVEAIQLDPALNGSKDFAFRLPDSPYSFSGKLISLSWAVEFVADPYGMERLDPIIVGPDRKEIQLETHEATPESV